ncbi:MAG TPA: type II secretion system secretin GspD [Anaeromyxobacteraceae bacterium]|nr:type II secretion system secretin GspD [Anaeromyxobacteraceae bacterium]
MSPAPGATPPRAVGAPGAPPAPGAPAAGAPRAGDEGTASISRDGRCTPMQGRFLLAFNKAEIVDLLEQASRWTCRNFIYTDEIARGKITLISKTPVTADEAYAAFLAALTANNIAIYPSGRYWKVIRTADAKKTPIPTYLEGSAVPQTEQPVTKLIRLKHADPDQLRALLANFTSPQGADLQIVQPDVLIVTDIGVNVHRLERMIDTIDRPGSGDLVRFIQVRYAPAKDVADKLNQVFGSGSAAPQPGRPARRSTIVAPGQPGAVAGGESTEISITKVLADDRTNKLLVIADEKSFDRIRELVEQLDVPAAGEGQIHVVFMKNANAEDLAQTLSALAQGQATTRRPGTPGAPAIPGMPQPIPAVANAQPGAATSAALLQGEVKVTADKASNALIIMASGSDFATMRRLIDKLDTPRRQVFVEAVIMEVNLQNETQFGVSAHGAIPFSTSDGQGFIPLGSQTGRVSSFNPSSLLQLGGFLTGLVGPVSAELKDVFPVSSVSVLLQALQTSSDVNVISTPHVLASDNEESEITVGQNVPFQAGFSPGLSGVTSALGGTTTTGTTASTTNLAGLLGLGGLSSLYAPIQRQNVELRLRIKPQISEGDMIRLELDEQTEEIASQDPQLGPTTAKRSVKTKIVVKDQNTIVIGGLYQERAVKSVTKLPFLGDIPVLGWLFRDQVTTKTKTNLLLFLTPYIIRDPADYRRILERKRREQQEFVEQFYGEQHQYEVFVDYARKSGPYAQMRRDMAVEEARLENGGAGTPDQRTIGPDSRSTTPPSSAPGVLLPRRTAPPDATPAPGPAAAPEAPPAPPPTQQAQPAPAPQDVAPPPQEAPPGPPAPTP